MCNEARVLSLHTLPGIRELPAATLGQAVVQSAGRQEREKRIELEEKAAFVLSCGS